MKNANNASKDGAVMVPVRQGPIRVRVSVLNWNAAEETLACVTSLAALTPRPGMELILRVVDNGSSPEEVAKLEAGLPPGCLRRLERNLGFAPAHNLIIDEAIEAGDDYIWVLNNDAVVTDGALAACLRLLEGDPRCGAVSPVVLEQRDGGEVIDFLGSYHDWKALASPRLKSEALTRVAERERPLDMWVAGTAVVYRVSCLGEIGGFDPHFFAYFEDNDMGARLARAGYHNRMAYDAVVYHKAHNDMYADRPPYYFYLMTRNGFHFWRKGRSWLGRLRVSLRLCARALWTARELSEAGYATKSEACLLGLVDGVRGIGGAPNLQQRVPPLLLKLGRKFPYKAYALLG